MLGRQSFERHIFGWQGYSGQWYFHSIYNIDDLGLIGRANYIFVRREISGKRVPLYIGQSSDFSQRIRSHEKFFASLILGMNEIHVHLLAEDRDKLFRIETDLRSGHVTPLNAQGFGLFGIASGKY